MDRHRLQLVLTVHDQSTGARTERVFVRFPVSVGRGAGNDLRLTARTVSRHHGVFSHERGAILHYMDLHSDNGSFLDGVRLEPNVLLSLRDSDVLAIGPYHLTFYFRRGRPRSDRHATEPLPIPAEGPPMVSLWKDSLANSEPIRSLRAQHGPSDLLRRAAEVIELLADMIVLFRRPLSFGRSVLRTSNASDEITAYLMSPASGFRSLDELRELLTEMFTPPPVPGA